MSGIPRKDLYIKALIHKYILKKRSLSQKSENHPPIPPRGLLIISKSRSPPWGILGVKIKEAVETPSLLIYNFSELFLSEIEMSPMLSSSYFFVQKKLSWMIALGLDFYSEE